jgi:hypothetical protein
MFVVIWEPKHGRGGGHQLATDAAKAEWLKQQIGRQKPDHMIRIETAEAYGAAAVAYRGQSYRYG